MSKLRITRIRGSETPRETMFLADTDENEPDFLVLSVSDTDGHTEIDLDLRTALALRFALNEWLGRHGA